MSGDRSGHADDDLPTCGCGIGVDGGGGLFT